MLDYAANAVLYGPVESVRARFASTCEVDALGPLAFRRSHTWRLVAILVELIMAIVLLVLP